MICSNVYRVLITTVIKTNILLDYKVITAISKNIEWNSKLKVLMIYIVLVIIITLELTDHKGVVTTDTPLLPNIVLL